MLRARVTKRSLFGPKRLLFDQEKSLWGAKNIEFNLRVSGSAALDLAYVASGRLDGFFQKKLNIWDIAAGALIISEAGGKISPIDTKKIKNHTIIASSEIIFDNLNKLIVNF